MNGNLNVFLYVSLSAMWHLKRGQKKTKRMGPTIRRKDNYVIIWRWNRYTVLPHFQYHRLIFFCTMTLIQRPFCWAAGWLSAWVRCPDATYREVWGLISSTNIVHHQTSHFSRNKAKTQPFHPQYIWMQFCCNWYPANIFVFISLVSCVALTRSQLWQKHVIFGIFQDLKEQSHGKAQYVLQKSCLSGGSF